MRAQFTAAPPAPLPCCRRHVVQLLTPASVLAKTNGRDTISRGDLDEVAALFHDAKASAQLLAEQADKYIT